MNLEFNKKCIWNRLKNCNKSIILYGMGNGADKIIKVFEEKKIPIYGVMASDDFVRYQDFHGFTVKKLSDFEKELDEFIICLCFGSDLNDVIDHIIDVSKKHTLLIPNVSLFGNEIVNDDFLKKNEKKINDAYALLEDEKSKSVYIKSIEFLYTGELDLLNDIESPKDEGYSLLNLSNDEKYLDLGAYTGDTVDEFINHTGSYTYISAVEPNIKNFKKLKENIKEIENCEALNIGISDKAGFSYITKGSGKMATLKINNEKTEMIETKTLDDLFSKKEYTYIKADIEGMEMEMLSSADKALSSKPKLCISAYHKPSDMWNLILKIHKINKEYKFFLRKFKYIPLWDLNLYAV